MSTRSSSQAGFNLIEVLVAMALIALVCNSLVASFISQSKFNSLSQERTWAAQAAQMVLDDLRSDDIVTMTALGSEIRTITVGENQYRAQIEYCSEASFCTSSTIRHLRVRISRHGTTLYDVQTVYTQL